MTREVESYLMEKFVKSYQTFPEGTLEQRDPPYTDFVLTTKFGKTIGIELTEALHSEEAREQSTISREFAHMVLSELENRMDFRFALDVDLDFLKPISKHHRQYVAAEVAAVCLEEFTFLPPAGIGEVENLNMPFSEIDDAKVLAMIRNRGYRNLPRGIQRIRLHRFDGITKSWNLQGEGGSVPNFTDDTLVEILRKKEKKLQRYKPCDQFWLVITEGNYFTGTFDSIFIQKSVRSNFDKIFILRCNENLIFQIK